MTDHVAVLRKFRETGGVTTFKELDAALDHAIAAVAERDSLREEHEGLHALYLQEAAGRIDAENERDALVARLGELEAEVRKFRDGWFVYFNGKEQQPQYDELTTIADAARVVAGNGGGDGG